MSSNSAPFLEPPFTDSVIALSLQEWKGERTRKQCLEAEAAGGRGGVKLAVHKLPVVV